MYFNREYFAISPLPTQISMKCKPIVNYTPNAQRSGLVIGMWERNAVKVRVVMQSLRKSRFERVIEDYSEYFQ